MIHRFNFLFLPFESRATKHEQNMAYVIHFEEEKHRRLPSFWTYSCVAAAINIALQLDIDEEPAEDVRAALEAALVALDGRAASV
jgi:hypothetical protein